MLMAFRAMCHHAMRSLLTLLGIVIGITGIIAVSAIGKGAQQKARDQWLAYGTKSVSISTGNFMSPTQKPPKPLTIDDLEVITSQCPSVQYISPSFETSQISVEYDGEKTSAKIEGGNEQTLMIGERGMQRGIYFTKQHVDRRENVAVLSPEMAEFFFKQRSPLDAVILINKIPFIVIGVVAPLKAKGKWEGIGLPRIYMPYTCFQKYFGKDFGQIEMSTYTAEQVPELVRQLEKIFRSAHVLEEGAPNDFMIWDIQTFASAAEEASKSVGLFALIAAIIALLVGGIGVMNIMLVAVQERTKEIGIKAALGATRSVIRTQFLIEAVAICIIGGILGVLLGIGASLVLKHLFGMLAIIELTPILVSLFFTAFIGLVFGLYPAEKAARLKPVEALTEY